MIENPWEGFQASERMVHEDDVRAVSEHNQRSKPSYQFLLHLAPEPWIGNIKGNLLVLYANPGATQDNLNMVFQQKHELVVEKTIKNLSQSNNRFPHFHFDPELEGTEGWRWFQSKYRWVLDQVDAKLLAYNLVTCELAPYHSMKWKVPKRMPPTQVFTYNLIEQAMERDAVILLARTPKIWIKNIPKLASYPKMFRPNSINASISPGNYPGEFEQILEAASKGD